MNAVRVEVLQQGGRELDRAMDVAPGTLLMDACERHGAAVEFSCRAASCSTCRVQVLAGSELLAPADAWEQELLLALGNPAATRFCCSARLADDARGGTVRLLPMGPAF